MSCRKRWHAIRRAECRCATLAKSLALLLAVFCAVAPAWAQNVPSLRVGNEQIEITGGSGKEAWRMRYGTGFERKVLLVVAGTDRAWFSHVGWLRLIDTKKGVVIGRWRFPDEITALTPQGNKVQVDVLHDSGNVKSEGHFLFDLAAPVIPDWPFDHLLNSRSPVDEAAPARAYGGVSSGDKVSAEQKQKWIPELEESIRRDPLSPWFREKLGEYLHEAKDPRASQVFREALQVAGNDFTELFRLYGLLGRNGEPDLAREAFERGLRDFWQRGYDPRMFIVLIDRLILFVAPPWKVGAEEPPPGVREEFLQNLYRWQPYGEASELAYEMYGRYLERKGQAEQAAVWRARVRETQENSPYMFNIPLTRLLDEIALLPPAIFLACVFFAFFKYFRYRPQRRLHLASRQPGQSVGFAFLNIQYWSRQERVAFLLIVLVGWYSAGVVGVFSRAFIQQMSLPLSAGSGSFGGPATLQLWEQRQSLAQTPDRKLLLALSFQQNGENTKAEQLYRSLPQFAVSWNNLGALLLQAGKKAEAQQAFERALSLDPQLAEAALNLGRPTNDFWTQQFRKYVPDRPMVAPPRRGNFVRTLMGGSSAWVAILALQGPFAHHPEYKSLAPFFKESSSDELPESLGITYAIAWAFVPLVPIALAIVFLVPLRDVTQSPSRRHWIGEVLFPGASAVWSWAGTFVLAAWSYAVIQALLVAKFGTSYILLAMIHPNIARSFGVDPVIHGGTTLFRYFGPDLKWAYGPVIVIFLLNFVLVWRQKRRESSVSTS